MENKMYEIIEDLNGFHKNIGNIKKISETFIEYIEAIRKEKTIIDNYNQDTINKIITLQENLETYMESMKSSIQNTVKEENNLIIESYNKFLKSIDENNKFINESCNRYLESIEKQDKLLRDNQTIINEKMMSLMNQAEVSLKHSLNIIEEQQKKIIDGFNIIEDLKKLKKVNTIGFSICGVAMIITIILLVLSFLF